VYSRKYVSTSILVCKVVASFEYSIIMNGNKCVLTALKNAMNAIKNNQSCIPTS